MPCLLAWILRSAQDDNALMMKPFRYLGLFFGFATTALAAYTDKHYRVLRFRDLVHWEEVTAQAVFPFENTPERMRHGTVIAVPRALIDRLRRPEPSHAPENR
jgi:hypothetical protein